MSYTAPTDSDVGALAGTRDAITGLYYHVANAAYASEDRKNEILRKAAGRAGPYNCAVYKDGDATFGVTAGKYINGDTVVNYAGASEQELTDDDTNYVYLTAAGALTVNITGFPTPSATPHVRLATIAVGSESAAAASGAYDWADITDCRGRSVLSVLYGLSSTRTVEASTAGVGSPNVLSAGESGKVLTNEGSEAKNYHTLPTAAAGLTFTFVVKDSDGLRVTAAAGDTIRTASTVSKAAGYAESTTIGAALTLVAINATEWIATSIVADWTVETA